MTSVSPRFSRVVKGAPDISKKEMLCRSSSPFSGQPDSGAVHILSIKFVFGDRQKEKRTLPRAFADVSRFVCVATFPMLFEGIVFFWFYYFLVLVQEY